MSLRGVDSSSRLEGPHVIPQHAKDIAFGSSSDQAANSRRWISGDDRPKRQLRIDLNCFAKQREASVCNQIRMHIQLITVHEATSQGHKVARHWSLYSAVSLCSSYHNRGTSCTP